MGVLNARLRGLLVLALTAVGSYVLMYRVYRGALAGEDDMWFSMKGIYLLPMFGFAGVGMVLGGELFETAVTREKKLTPIGWVFTGVCIAAGFGLHFWFEHLLAGLGYEIK